MNKHSREAHIDDHQKPAYQMKPLKGSRRTMTRLITEGVFIDTDESSNPGSLKNSKGEAGRGKMVRYVPMVRRI